MPPSPPEEHAKTRSTLSRSTTAEVILPKSRNSLDLDLFVHVVLRKKSNMAITPDRHWCGKCNMASFLCLHNGRRSPRCGL